MHAVTPIEREPAPKAMLRHRARMRLAALAWRFHLQERGDLFRGGPSEESMAEAQAALREAIYHRRAAQNSRGNFGRDSEAGSAPPPGAPPEATVARSACYPEGLPIAGGDGFPPREGARPAVQTAS